jgi:hypothetical protein
MRAMMSVMPPAAAVTTNFTAREGNAGGLVCAITGNAAGNAQIKPRKIISRFNMDMVSPECIGLAGSCHKKLTEDSSAKTVIEEATL